MEILTVMQKVGYATKHQVAKTQTQWKEGPSRVNNTDKKLKDEVVKGNLIHEDDYFKLKTCEGKHSAHSRDLTDCLIDILLINPEAIIIRERLIEISMIPDSLILLRKGDKARCLVLEVCTTETENFLQAKVNLWLNHPEANRILSDIFQVKIPHFDIIISGKPAPKGTISLTQYLEEVCLYSSFFA